MRTEALKKQIMDLVEKPAETNTVLFQQYTQSNILFIRALMDRLPSGINKEMVGKLISFLDEEYERFSLDVENEHVLNKGAFDKHKYVHFLINLDYISGETGRILLG